MSERTKAEHVVEVVPRHPAEGVANDVAAKDDFHGCVVAWATSP